MHGTALPLLVFGNYNILECRPFLQPKATLFAEMPLLGKKTMMNSIERRTWAATSIPQESVLTLILFVARRKTAADHSAAV